MARTKASVGAKVASGKSSKARCSVAAPPSNSVTPGSSGSSKLSSGGGNPVCPRETPKWQRPITNFFITKETNGKAHEPEEPDKEEASKCFRWAAVSEAQEAKETALANPPAKRATASSSRSKPKRNIIESDEEEECPKNKELDESIHLEPLTGENSHKLDEYYPKNGVKGKGVGKKTKGKENVDSNRKRRDLDESFEEQASKKVKVC